ncbi:MAG: hypothetical protein Q4C91_21055 [Eubacteriales bacterium]|nr:hypothetical protein [Eubacteriales bacterium]
MQKNIWREELTRCFLNWRFPCAVILTTVLYLLITMRYSSDKGMDILYYYRLVADNDLLLLSYAFCSWVYSGVYCDEKKGGYDKYCLLRIPAGSFMKIRTGICILSGAVVRIAGAWGYLIILRFRHPFLNIGGSSMREFGSPSWGMSGLVTQNRILLYFGLEILLAGCMAGLLCGAAFCFSLFLQEKSAVLVFPVFLSYFLLYYANGYLKLPIWLQINKIFDTSYNVLGNDVYSFLYGIGCFVSGTFLLCTIAKKKYKRLVYE